MLLAAVLSGGAIVLVAGSAVAYRLTTPTSEPLLEVTHLPPLLTVPGEPVELRYDVYCSPGETAVPSEAPCDARGTVYVRSGDAGAFREVPLRLDPGAVEGRYVAIVPQDIVESRLGFSYYVVVRNGENGLPLTLPAAGPAAPQGSLPLDPVVTVDLGTHAFGVLRQADARPVEAAWGDGGSDVGLEQGRNLSPVGASAFDVDRSGTIHVLDEAHRRLLRWRPGARVPQEVALAINGTLADVSVADDGTIHVLETTRGADPRPLLRVFGPDGARTGEAEIAERGAEVQIGPTGPVVLQHPSGQWMPVVIAGQPLSPSAQRAAGRAGRPVPGGAEVVVLRQRNEIRAALAGANGVRRAWRIRSKTPLAEVQLAEPLGNGLVVVVRVYTDARDEFVVFVLAAHGLLRSFSLDSADWAETAPFGRFRLVGSSLYRLGSTPAGMFVDRFDLATP